MYWYCLEMIAAEVATNHLTFELEHDAEIIAHDMRMSREKVEDMMRYMVELGLFEESSGHITCLKLLKRIDLSQGGSKEFRQAILDKRKQVESGHSHDSVMTQSCIEVEVEVNKTTTTARPSVEQVAEYVATRQVQINPQAFVDYYTANGWKVGRNSMKDWRAAVRTWEKNENGKTAGRQSIETVYVD